MTGRRYCFRAFLTAVLTAVLAGCGGGSDTPASVIDSGPDTGQIVIALTDAEGDFSSYTVTVESIVLERLDGTAVETLPMRTEVDFAELTEVTELVTIATVPAGRYQGAILRLDYSDAMVVVQEPDGNLHDALVRDEAGNPIGSLDVRLELTETDQIVIRPGVPAAFSLDFDLDASNEIDFSAAPPIVTVRPFLLAAAELEADRAHRLRGLLDGVDEAEGVVTIDMRPFRHRRGNFGSMSFAVDAETLYEIDGNSYVGSEGIAALADLAAADGAIPVIAGGFVEEGGLSARTVLAGSSVPWTGFDVATGAVIARSADSLTLSGVVIEYSDGAIVRRDEVTLLLGSDTVVTALGLDNDGLDKDSVSVGQRVTAFGDLQDDLTLSVLDGHLRMNVSQLTATVTETDSLVADLHFLNARRPQAYDFSGTGVDADNDAEPSSYELDTRGLGLVNVEAGDLVRVRGHVNGFGQAPADFLALSVIDLSLDLRSATFAAVWPDVADPTTGISSDRIGLGLSDARAVLKLPGVPLSATNPLESQDLVAPDDDRGIYAVAVRGTGAATGGEIHLYRSFSELANELIRQFQAGNGLRHVSAHGSSSAPGELTTARAVFEFSGID